MRFRRAELGGFRADVDTLASSLTKTGWPARRGETVFNRDETRLKLTFACFQSNSGIDHAGHHQPLLPAVLQGGIICHPNAESDPGLNLQRLK